jgi:hypothetical protein
LAKQRVQNGNLQYRYINFVRRLFIDEFGVRML